MAQSFAFAAFKKAGKFYFLQSSQNIRERGNQLFRRVVFPSPLDPHPFLAATRGVPLDPLCRFFVAQSFGGQRLSSRPTFWHRYRPSLCKRPVPKLQKAVLFAIVRRSFMEESCFCFWKSKANSTFCKVVKQKGEAFWQPLQPWFVKETAFFFAKAQNLR